MARPMTTKTHHGQTPGHSRRGFLGGLVAGGAATAALTAGARTAAAGPLQDIIDVTAFGAVGDGVADDTEALQFAIDHGQAHGHPVYLPAGVYKVTGTLRIRGDVDLFGNDANNTAIYHASSASTCIWVEADDPDDGARYVSLRRFSVRTSQPRRTGTPYQTGIYVRGGFWNVHLQELIVQDFMLGIFLRQCWTARVRNCSVERSLLHCIKWENATAGEITGNRFDCISGSTVTGLGNHCAFVTFSHVPHKPGQFHETLSLSVANNAFQQSELAGFYGRGVGNVTFVNNFFEGNNRRRTSASLYLAEGTDPAGAVKELRVANVIGGFFTPGKYGGGVAVKIGDYDAVNMMGVDIRGGAFSQGLHLYGANTRSNLIGVHSDRPNYFRCPPNLMGSVL